MFLRQGLPTIESYKRLLKSNLFHEMEKFSNRFLGQNELALEEYSRKWVSDPLHQWSRQYEYPFVYTYVYDYINSQINPNIKILDAGSGATFFPFYLSLISSNIKVDCCDYDISLGQVFCEVNRTSGFSVNFSPADIRHLPFDEGSYDIVYCISVLEHTEDFKVILREFKRVLKKKGHFILTFDISIDGSADVSKEKAVELIEELETLFHCIDGFSSKLNLGSLNNKKILTTRYVAKFDKKLLPWRHSWRHRLVDFRDLITRRTPISLTCFCKCLINE